MARKRTKAVSKSNATPCPSPSCKRVVLPTNKSYPYCHDHWYIKTARSNLVNLDKYSMDFIRETLYNPERTYIPPVLNNVDMIRYNSMISDKNITRTYSLWNKLSRKNKIDTSDPLQAHESLDFMIDNMKDKLSKNNDVKVFNCNSGNVIIPTMGIKRTDDHKILYVVNEEDDFIVDTATAAPLHYIQEGLVAQDKDVRDFFPSGTNSCLDGINIKGLYEYCAFSNIRYNEFVDSNTGEVLWNNVSYNREGQKEIKQQRDLVQQSNYNKPVHITEMPNSYISKWLERQKQTDPNKITQDKLKEMIAEEDDLDRLLGE